MPPGPAGSVSPDVGVADALLYGEAAPSPPVSVIVATCPGRPCPAAMVPFTVGQYNGAAAVAFRAGRVSGVTGRSVKPFSLVRTVVPRIVAVSAPSAWPLVA